MPSQSTQSESAGGMFSTTQGRAHKLISFIMILHVLKASASNGSKTKSGSFFYQKLWSGIVQSLLNGFKDQPLKLLSVFEVNFF